MLPRAYPWVVKETTVNHKVQQFLYIVLLFSVVFLKGVGQAFFFMMMLFSDLYYDA